MSPRVPLIFLDILFHTFDPHFRSTPQVRYVAGLSSPSDVLDAVSVGLDLFDNSYVGTVTAGKGLGLSVHTSSPQLFQSLPLSNKGGYALTFKLQAPPHSHQHQPVGDVGHERTVPQDIATEREVQVEGSSIGSTGDNVAGSTGHGVASSTGHDGYKMNLW